MKKNKVVQVILVLIFLFLSWLITKGIRPQMQTLQGHRTSSCPVHFFSCSKSGSNPPTPPLHIRTDIQTDNTLRDHMLKNSNLTNSFLEHYPQPKMNQKSPKDPKSILILTMKLLYTYFWKTLPIGALIWLTLIWLI